MGGQGFGNTKHNVGGKYYNCIKFPWNFANVLNEIEIIINDKTQIISRWCRANLSIPNYNFVLDAGF